MSEDTDQDRAGEAPLRKSRSAYAVHAKERMPYSAPTVLPPAAETLPDDYYLQPRRRISGWAIAGGALLIWWFVYNFVFPHPAPKKAPSPVPVATDPLAGRAAHRSAARRVPMPTSVQKYLLAVHLATRDFLAEFGKLRNLSDRINKSSSILNNPDFVFRVDTTCDDLIALSDEMGRIEPVPDECQALDAKLKEMARTSRETVELFREGADDRRNSAFTASMNQWDDFGEATDGFNKEIDALDARYSSEKPIGHLGRVPKAAK